jgi:signal-transduction protein with cAMP-binding, CBS, and nucleotidyltransferase domain
MLQNSNSQNLLSQIQSINNMLNGKNPDELFKQLMQNNPQFRQFYEANKDKTPEQIAKENGIDLTNFLK